MSVVIENLKDKDPFGDVGEDTGVASKKKKKEAVHIRIQQRNGRKSLTTISGLPFDKDQLEDVIRYVKKKFACNGNLAPFYQPDYIKTKVAEIDEKAAKGEMTAEQASEEKEDLTREVIQLQGDQRKPMYDFITTPIKQKGLGIKADKVKVHGF